jgi:hypothetical protein
MAKKIDFEQVCSIVLTHQKEETMYALANVRHFLGNEIAEGLISKKVFDEILARATQESENDKELLLAGRIDQVFCDKAIRERFGLAWQNDPDQLKIAAEEIKKRNS